MWKSVVLVILSVTLIGKSSAAECKATVQSIVDAINGVLLDKSLVLGTGYTSVPARAEKKKVGIRYERTEMAPLPKGYRWTRSCSDSDISAKVAIPVGKEIVIDFDAVMEDSTGKILVDCTVKHAISGFTISTGNDLFTKGLFGLKTQLTSRENPAPESQSIGCTKDDIKYMANSALLLLSPLINTALKPVFAKDFEAVAKARLKKKQCSTTNKDIMNAVNGAIAVLPVSKDNAVAFKSVSVKRKIDSPDQITKLSCGDSNLDVLAASGTQQDPLIILEIRGEGSDGGTCDMKASFDIELYARPDTDDLRIISDTESNWRLEPNPAGKCAYAKDAAFWAKASDEAWTNVQANLLKALKPLFAPELRIYKSGF